MDDELEVDRPAWSSNEADRMIGKMVLLGITRLDAAGVVASQEQLHGEIVECDERRGIRIELHGVRMGEDYWLPPQTDCFRPAAPGIYRLRSTGEEVENPDLLSNWTIQAPADA